MPVAWSAAVSLLPSLVWTGFYRQSVFPIRHCARILLGNASFMSACHLVLLSPRMISIIARIGCINVVVCLYRNIYSLMCMRISVACFRRAFGLCKDYYACNLDWRLVKLLYG